MVSSGGRRVRGNIPNGTKGGFWRAERRVWRAAMAWCGVMCGVMCGVCVRRVTSVVVRGTELPGLTISERRCFREFMTM